MCMHVDRSCSSLLCTFTYASCPNPTAKPHTSTAPGLALAGAARSPTINARLPSFSEKRVAYCGVTDHCNSKRSHFITKRCQPTTQAALSCKQTSLQIRLYIYIYGVFVVCVWCGIERLPWLDPRIA